MKWFIQLRRALLVAGFSLLALGGASAARADVADTDFTVYVSSPGKGKIAGVSYGDEDVLRYSPTSNPQWSMHFDGSAAGLPAAADIDAYAYNYNAATFTTRHFISFDRPVKVPGLGKVDDSDVVVYRQGLLGTDWSLYLDGSAVGLTQDGEDIDAISYHQSSGNIFFSTSGNYELIGASNTLYSGDDKDQLMWSNQHKSINSVFPGALYGIPVSNDLHNLDFEFVDGKPAYYFGLLIAGNMGGVAAGANDVVFYRNDGTTETYELFWDASASGFKKIDAFEIVLK